MNAHKNSDIKKHLILTDSHGNELNFNSICKSLKHSKLGMGDIKELTDVILKSLKKMPYKDLSETLESIYESKSSHCANSSNETLSKSNFKGYDADVSKSINNNNEKLKIGFKSNLNENYFQRTFNSNYHRLSNFVSQQNVSNRFENTDTNKTSSSGVYSESPLEHSDFENESDLEVVTRIIEDSYNIDNDYNGSDCDCDTQIDDLYEYSTSSCESEYNGFDTQQTNGNQTHSHSNISDSNSDILNRSATSWLSQCRNDCDCNKCYIDRLERKAEISCLNEQNSTSSSVSSQFHPSSTPFYRTKKRTYLQEILFDSSQLLGASGSTTSSSVLHCTGNDLCLICMQNSKREQSVHKSLQL